MISMYYRYPPKIDFFRHDMEVQSRTAFCHTLANTLVHLDPVCDNEQTTATVQADLRQQVPDFKCLA